MNKTVEEILKEEIPANFTDKNAIVFAEKYHTLYESLMKEYVNNTKLNQKIQQLEKALELACEFIKSEDYNFTKTVKHETYDHIMKGPSVSFETISAKEHFIYQAQKQLEEKSDG